MRRGQTRIFITGLALTLLTVSAQADNSRDGDLIVAHGSGMMCFSIRPANRTSCDALCADKGAACTATASNRNPQPSCADPIDDPPATLCRCCAVAR